MPSVRHVLSLSSGLFALIWLAAAPATAEDAEEHVLGSPDAPVTIIEYASMSCPHCAAFHTEGLPWLKENYIDTGKVRLVFRDFPHNEMALLGAVVAHCAGPDRYFAFVDTIFKNQKKWAFGDDPVGTLAKLARARGMGKETFDACLADEAIQEKILQTRLDAHETYKISSIPSFIINGELLTGNPTPEILDEHIAKAMN